MELTDEIPEITPFRALDVAEIEDADVMPATA
jgi:hypothetical protein